MSRDLSPAAVARRLDRLRALYVPETDTEGRRRLAMDARPQNLSFADGVGRRLAELRALDDLTATCITATGEHDLFVRSRPSTSVTALLCVWCVVDVPS